MRVTREHQRHLRVRRCGDERRRGLVCEEEARAGRRPRGRARAGEPRGRPARPAQGGVADAEEHEARVAGRDHARVVVDHVEPEASERPRPGPHAPAALVVAGDEVHAVARPETLERRELRRRLPYAEVDEVAGDDHEVRVERVHLRDDARHEPGAERLPHVQIGQVHDPQPVESRREHRDRDVGGGDAGRPQRLVHAVGAEEQAGGERRGGEAPLAEAREPARGGEAERGGERVARDGGGEQAQEDAGREVDRPGERLHRHREPRRVPQGEAAQDHRGGGARARDRGGAPAAAAPGRERRAERPGHRGPEGGARERVEARPQQGRAEEGVDRGDERDGGAAEPHEGGGGGAARGRGSRRGEHAREQAPAAGRGRGAARAARRSVRGEGVARARPRYPNPVSSATAAGPS
ncbi:MAG TPA: hypothetical protein VGQ83_32680, partial [Polyangia bacterium]